MPDREKSDLPLDHPEIKDLFWELLTNLVAESDRGAVLIGASHVDRHLGRLFEEIAPSELGKKSRKALLEYPGPLSTFSARVEVAYATRIIGRRLYDSLHALRRVRNDVAHQPSSFNLREQADRIRLMYGLGPTMPVAVNRLALDIMMRTKISPLVNVKHPREDRPYFNSLSEVIDYISENPDMIEKLDAQRPRYELAIGIGFICALLVWHREETLRVVGTDGILAFVDGKSEGTGLFIDFEAQVHKSRYPEEGEPAEAEEAPGNGDSREILESLSEEAVSE